MLKLLFKKQLMEVFRQYFYDAKKNKKRSTGAIITYFALFIILMVGVLGFVFTNLSNLLCSGLSNANMGWLYFVIMSGVSILLGTFGSVFNTFSGLYLSKDNDLLLSMPIPVKYIIISRLLNVYFLGSLYSLIVIVPAIAVYFLQNGFSFIGIIGSLILALLITVIVLILSCILGWCVAKISKKLKNKSFITVLISLAFFGGYYFFYFKAQVIINSILANATIYGTKIKGSAYFLYLFGTIGCGNIKSGLLYMAIVGLSAVIIWFILKNTFIDIATTDNVTKKKKHKADLTKQKSIYSALLLKEFSKFISSPNYMLNCGFGILTIPIGGVLLLVKGDSLLKTLESAFINYPSAVIVFICCGICAMTSMNDMVAPSVSLEGKNIWILQSLPVSSKLILHSKITMQLILTYIPVMFTLACALYVIKATVIIKIIIALSVVLFILFTTLLSAFIGLKTANLNWTNEIIPIKQSFSVFVAIVGGVVFSGAFIAGYFILGYRIDLRIYMLLWIILYIIGSALLIVILKVKGSKWFNEL